MQHGAHRRTTVHPVASKGSVFPLSTQVQPFASKRSSKSLKSSSFCNLSLWERAAWLCMSTWNAFLIVVCVVDVAGSNSWVSHRSFTNDPKCKHTSSSCRHLSTMLNGPSVTWRHYTGSSDIAVGFGRIARRLRYSQLANCRTVGWMRYFRSQRL